GGSIVAFVWHWVIGLFTVRSRAALKSAKRQLRSRLRGYETLISTVRKPGFDRLDTSSRRKWPAHPRNWVDKLLKNRHIVPLRLTPASRYVENYARYRHIAFP